MNKFSFLPAVLAGAGTVLAVATMPAQAFVINSVLTGDTRLQNPDNLFVNVTIQTGTDAGLAANQALWTIDINSPLHPNIKLDEFYFNLANSVNTSQVSFSGFNPNGWAINSPATVQGAGGVGNQFRFETLDPSGPPNAADVTNTQNLTFIMTYAGGALTQDMFFLSPVALSNDAGSGQLGAHLQSLNALPGQSDSGFAFGVYGGQNGATDVPEPFTMLGTGAALGFSALFQRERNKRQKVQAKA